jgi:biotin operon repressor
MTPDVLTHRQTVAPTLSERQQTVLTLVTAYYAVAHEWPSSGWLSRRLQISRKRAWQHLTTLRDRRFLDRDR